jgi:hypothetical protein
MLEWKILAAAFAALLVISIVLVGNTGLKDIFGDIVGRITDWMGNKPFTLPGENTAGDHGVSVTFYPDNFTLTPEARINFTLSENEFENFNGEISVDFANNRITLKEKGSSFSVSSPVQPLTIQELKISSLALEGMRFTVKSAQSDITNDNGTIEIKGFLGTFSVGNSSISLEGNVTKITGDGWSIG